MSVKPIDFQTNIAKIPDVAKDEETRALAQIGQRQAREEESSEKSKLVSSRLKENRELEKTAIKREENRKKRGKHRGGRDNEAKRDIEGKSILKDEKIGNIIDIKK
ncbi:MAG: hypothetical protein SVR08_10420 [Spirochaetota bacterium]|nr:hypothetical protein [Spirochaetota bacterium]